ncbi:multiple sugar transport system permease protein [Bacillus tianshenii]|jgi:multiple sugar transport system permease protein|uniref:Multiple sugar transport system permease protein n=2 Tax=Sutcliffiella tianshenii TaxID=1463404 RepID=A0ABS2NZL8_9BACI|nr:carbohydrate ABC transporter permease [Bacillus tianshenii]MBM7619813.1 multiple sugar transport system permease protein [Bacillus tianshenii]MCA1318615.1 carbohydrate ABC transporter permease [Bacillus tianshenii]
MQPATNTNNAQYAELAIKREKARNQRKKVYSVLSWAILLFWVVLTIIPLYWMVISSFRDTTVSASFKPEWFPSKVTLATYIRFLTETDAVRWLMNSLFVSSVLTLSNVVFSSLAGYAFAKLSFPGRKTIFWLLLGTMMIPAQVTLIPVYIMVVNIFGLVDTYLAIMLPMFTVVGNIFLMKQYMSTLPTTLIQAARIDGCSEFGIFRKVILPISKPGVAVLAIFTFVSTWNEFFWPFLVTQSSSMRTIQVGLASFKFQDATDYGAMMAGSVLAALPMFILFFALQRYFLQGITIGAVKG